MRDFYSESKPAKNKYRIEDTQTKRGDDLVDKAKLFTILIATIIFSGIAYAIPNPAPIYCEEMGYKTDGENCVFNDGEICEAWSFYRGECGSEYVKELACTTLGNSNLPGHECCENLVPTTPASGTTINNGVCAIAIGGWPVCLACGDGMCDDELENSCNCPSDCSEPTACPAEIDITSSKTTYYTGDESLLTISIYDDSGNPIPFSEFSINAVLETESERQEVGPSYYATDSSGKHQEGGTATDVEEDITVHYTVYTETENCERKTDNLTIKIISDDNSCVCPEIYSPVCGVDGQTYANKCFASCEDTGIAYEGKCRPQDTIKVELGQKFELFERQKAMLLENGRNTGVDITLVGIYAPTYTTEDHADYVNIRGLVAQLQISKTEGDVASGTNISLQVGESTKVFGITFTALSLEHSSQMIVLVAEKDSVPETVSARLGEKFDLFENQTAYISHNERDVEVMKINFENVSVTNACTSSGGVEVDCDSGTYAQFHISVENAGSQYVSLRQGQSRNIGNYKVSLLSLHQIKTNGMKYSATLVVEKISEPETIVVYLDKAFNLQEKQKAIVRETNMQLKVVSLSEDGAVVEVLSPIRHTQVRPTTVTSTGSTQGRAMNANSVAGSVGIATADAVKTAVETVRESIATQSMVYRPYIKLRQGQSETIYGHKITLNMVAFSNCTADANCIGEAGFANFTVSMETEPDIKKVHLNEKFELATSQTAIVLDEEQNNYGTNYEAMRIKLEGIATPMIMCKEGSVCDVRPMASVSIKSELFNGALSLREGQERMVGNHSVRLLDISGSNAVFIVKKAVSDILKVHLDEHFGLKQKQTALVSEENLYIKLEGVEIVRCVEEDSRCIGGSYAHINVWKNISHKENESRTIGLHQIREGETLNLYGVRITLRELSGRGAEFVVRKGDGGVINVHVGEPFKLKERQAARVLEANMRLDLLNIFSPDCSEEEDCIGASQIVEISVSNYLFSKAETGREVRSIEYAETVVERTVSAEGNSVTSSVSNEIGAMPVPPKPFDVIMLRAGESTEVNDFVITVLNISYNHAEFVVKRKGSNTEMKLEIHKGWNLFSIPGDLDVISSSECESSDFKLFEYIASEKRFEKVSEPKKGKAYWLYNPGNSCQVQAVVREYIGVHKIDSLIAGWNFVPVTVDMIGTTIGKLGEDCGLKAAFFYNATSNKWEPALDKKIGENDLGKAIAVYATNACSLGNVTHIPEPIPAFPELPGTEE